MSEILITLKDNKVRSNRKPSIILVLFVKWWSKFEFVDFDIISIIKLKGSTKEKL